MKYSCVSADCHIDLYWLPPDLFRKNASNAMRERMPYVKETADGPVWVSGSGEAFGYACGLSGFGGKYMPGRNPRADKMAAEGLYEQESKQSLRLTDPHQRVKDQDRDGVQAEILYGIRGSVFSDREAAPEMHRIYNEWLASFCREYPERLIGLASINVNNVADAVAEVKRVARAGLKGVEMATSFDMIPLVEEQLEPLWNEIDNAGLPVHFHITNLRGKETLPAHWSRRETQVAAAVRVTSAPFVSANTFLSSLIYAGVLERHPAMNVVLGESGIGWIPYVLEHMNHEWEERFRHDLNLKMSPSEYWHRQCKGTFQYDEVGVKLLEVLGADTLMWGSDFPHMDGVWPDSQHYIQKQFGHLPAEARRKITCDNAVAVYRL